MWYICKTYQDYHTVISILKWLILWEFHFDIILKNIFWVYECGEYIELLQKKLKIVCFTWNGRYYNPLGLENEEKNHVGGKIENSLQHIEGLTFGVLWIDIFGSNLVI